MASLSGNKMKLFEIQNKTKAWLDKMAVENYTINSDGTIDVDGNVVILRKNMRMIPVQFGEVSGNFDCSLSHLTSLKGSPKTVGGDFFCTNNELTSLEGAPREVGKDFLCYQNRLTTLKGGPKEIGRDFYCQENQLTDLKGAPKDIGGDFLCDANEFESEPDHSFVEYGGVFTWA